MPTVNLSLDSLVHKCLDKGDSRDWEDLVARLQPVFARVAYRVAASWGQVNADEIDDIIQEAFLRLSGSRPSPVLTAKFEDEASALAYFSTMAANVARDYFRAKYAQRRSAAESVQLDSRLEELCPYRESGLDRQLVLSQIDWMLPADERSRNIFWLYYRQGLTCKEIAAIPSFQLTIKGVESLLHRLTAAVRLAMTARPSEGNASAGAV